MQVTAETLSHPLVVGTLLAIGIAAARAVKSIHRAVSVDIPATLTAGHHRMDKIETLAGECAVEIRETREELRVHMANEEAALILQTQANADDRVERERRQAHLDERLAHLEEKR